MSYYDCSIRLSVSLKLLSYKNCAKKFFAVKIVTHGRMWFQVNDYTEPD